MPTFRVRRLGIFVGEARTLTDLGRIVDPSDLREALWGQAVRMHVAQWRLWRVGAITSLADLRDNADHEQMMAALAWTRIRLTQLERALASSGPRA